MHGFKIGRAKSLKNRLSNFGLVLPFKIELVHALKSSNMARTEWHFHNLFSHKRIKGEWFNLTDEDITIFCEAGTERGPLEGFYIEPTPNLTGYRYEEKDNGELGRNDLRACG